jgi:proline racemase
MSRHTFSCIDGHTCGNPVRLVAGGAPPLRGATMLEKRAHFLAEFDWIRTGLMFEPAATTGCRARSFTRRRERTATRPVC